MWGLQFWLYGFSGGRLFPSSSVVLLSFLHSEILVLLHRKSSIRKLWLPFHHLRTTTTTHTHMQIYTPLPSKEWAETFVSLEICSASGHRKRTNCGWNNKGRFSSQSEVQWAGLFWSWLSCAAMPPKNQMFAIFPFPFFASHYGYDLADCR